MQIDLYLQSDFTHAHEKEAMLNLVRSLQKKLRNQQTALSVVANLELSAGQIDALVFMEKAVIMVELKNCPEAVTGGEFGPWTIKDQQTPVQAGSHANPFIQARHNRGLLIDELNSRLAQFVGSERSETVRSALRQISAALVFVPTLHPDSDVRLPGRVQAWLRILGADSFAEYAWSRTSNLCLRPAEVHGLLSLWHCKQWNEAFELLPQGCCGHLYLLQEGRMTDTCWTLDKDLTIGRAHDNQVVLSERFRMVSRYHAHIQLRGQQAWLYDGVPTRQASASRFGTLVNDKIVDALSGRQLYDGDVICLGRHHGRNDYDECRLVFKQYHTSHESKTAFAYVPR